MNFANVKGLTIPQGKVTKIELLKDSMRTLLWQAMRYLKGYTIGGNAEVKDGRIVGVGDHDSASGKYSLPIVASNQSGSESTTYPLLVSSPLYKWGSVADVAKFGEGVTRKMGKKVFDGTENWQDAGANYGFSLRKNIYLPDVSPTYGLANALCNYYKMGYATNGAFYFYSVDFDVRDDNYTDVISWKAHLADLYAQGNPLTIIYELAEPVTEAVDLPKIVDYQPTILTTDTEVVGDITIEE